LGWQPFATDGLTNFRQTFVDENDEDRSEIFLVGFVIVSGIQSLSDAFKLSERVWASGAHEVQNDLSVLGENFTQGNRTFTIWGDDGQDKFVKRCWGSEAVLTFEWKRAQKQC
jgi:hypothetical protein